MTYNKRKSLFCSLGKWTDNNQNTFTNGQSLYLDCSRERETHINYWNTWCSWAIRAAEQATDVTSNILLLLSIFLPPFSGAHRASPETNTIFLLQKASADISLPSLHWKKIQFCFPSKIIFNELIVFAGFGDYCLRRRNRMLPVGNFSLYFCLKDNCPVCSWTHWERKDLGELISFHI